MEFENSGHLMTGGYGRSDQGAWWIFALVIFAIIFIIAIIALALFNRDDRKRNVDGGGIAEILAATVAAKGIGNDGYKANEITEIKAAIEHSEDRAVTRQTQAEIGNLGLMLQKTAADNELITVRELGELKAAQASTNQALAQVLQNQNNASIINGVVQQLLLMPRVA